MNGTVNNTSFFKDPPKEFRGLPFWAWNTDITYEKIKKQVAVFKEMGLGGFVIHVRHGLRNEYMGETFLTRVKETVDEAKKNDLTVWLYDEDRWPSGSAGGIVTLDKLEYRQKNILFTKKRAEYYGADCDSRRKTVAWNCRSQRL